MRHRRWTRVAAVLLLVIAGVVLVAGTSGRLPAPLPGSQACRASVAGTTVRLSTDDAERASARVARGESPGLDLSASRSRVVSTALTGRAPHALTCDHGPSSSGGDVQPLGPQGLTPRAAVVRRDLDAAFGPQQVGGFAPGGVTTGHMPGSAHYEGRAVDVFYRPVDAASRRRGWATAQYAVANAERLSIRTVIYDDTIWTARRAAEGWRDHEVDTTGQPPRTARVLEHRDHVHVDVS